MIVKRISFSDIIAFLGNRVLSIDGIQGVEKDTLYIDNLADIERVNETTLDWINPSKDNKQKIAKESRARVLLVDETIRSIKGKVLIHVKNPKAALAEVGNHFFVEKTPPIIHPTAIVDSKARIGSNVSIGPYTIIGNATIGNNCIIDSNVRIHDSVTIGDNCKIKAGAVLGSEGFGFERDENGNGFRFPQLGSLVIGNFVEIGANTCIDRGSLADTVISDYCKINNLCHIAHNNHIGKNVEIAGCVNISGSCIIDDDVWISPNVSLRGWQHIHKGAVIGTGAVVTKDIPEGETWVGNPARKLEKK